MEFPFVITRDWSYDERTAAGEFHGGLSHKEVKLAENRYTAPSIP